MVSICAVRTGTGKSQTTPRVAELLSDLGYKVAAVRHPMPYGDLVKQAVQRFASYKDLGRTRLHDRRAGGIRTAHRQGIIVYAGVDYERILRQAEAEVDVILWDGGNNDLPFYKSDLHIVVVDPHRPGTNSRITPARPICSWPMWW